MPNRDRKLVLNSQKVKKRKNKLKELRNRVGILPNGIMLDGIDIQDKLEDDALAVEYLDAMGAKEVKNGKD